MVYNLILYTCISSGKNSVSDNSFCLLVSILALCPTLTNPVNGAVMVGGLSVGDTASYTCIIGFELVGAVTVTCEDGGQWSSHPPVCQIVGINMP